MENRPFKNRPFFERLGFALNGIKTGFREERSMRSQAVVAAGLLPVLLILQPSLIWWAIAGALAAMVIAAELFNTALENLLDLVHPEYHAKVKLIKDCAAGGVLLLSMGALWFGFLMVLSVWA